MRHLQARLNAIRESVTQHLPGAGRLAAWAAVAIVIATFFAPQATLLVLCVAFAVWLAVGCGYEFVGPVGAYDRARMGRKSLTFWLRGLYGLVLLIPIWLGYEQLNETALLSGNSLAALGSAFFFSFIAVGYIGVILLTPPLVAGAIAEERDHRSLEVLLSTPIGERAIVLGKMWSRIGLMALIIITGLPILSLLQFWGGIEPGLATVGMVLVLFNLFSLASLSILFSVHAVRPRRAILLTYLVVAGYLILAWIAGRLTDWWMQTAPPSELQKFVRDIVEALGAGSLFTTMADLRRAFAQGQDVAAAIRASLQHAVIFHLTCTLICSGLAVAHVRQAISGSIYGSDAPDLWTRLRRRLRPAIGDQPVLWKELFTEPTSGGSPFGRVLVALILLVSFAPLAWLLLRWLPGARTGDDRDLLATWFASWQALPDWYATPETLIDAVRGWAQACGTLVAWLAFVVVAMRSAGSIVAERKAGTLDSLLAAGVPPWRILQAKWLGSIYAVRWIMVWLGLIWVLAVAIGNFGIVRIPWLVLVWLAYAGFLAALGLWFSVSQPSANRAVAWTLGIAVALSAGQFIPWLVIGSSHVSDGSHPSVAVLYEFQVTALSPPVMMFWLHGDDVRMARCWDDPVRGFVFLLIGLAIHAGAGWFLWQKANRRMMNPQSSERQIDTGRPRQTEFDGPFLKVGNVPAMKAEEIS
jgi:ABC-type transport system involved in multi-copper enzyme maturation permease subunit